MPPHPPPPSFLHHQMNKQMINLHIVSWVQEERYDYSNTFRWEPEGCYRSAKSKVIVPFCIKCKVLNGTSLNSVNTLLAFSRWYAKLINITIVPIQLDKTMDQPRINLLPYKVQTSKQGRPTKYNFNSSNNQYHHHECTAKTVVLKLHHPVLIEDHTMHFTPVLNLWC